MCEINDIRVSKDFNKITFSNFKKADAKKEFLKRMYDSKIEASCYWCAEFICAGHFIEIWEILFEFLSRYIHLGNPKLPVYIQMRYEIFKQIVSNGYIGNELRLRNNDKIRKLFAEIVCILCLSRKKHGLNVVKIGKDEFNITNLTSKLKAKKISYAEVVFRKEDPKELFIAINELSYHLSPDSKNTLLGCYWVEWIIEFGSICSKEKKLCVAGRRDNVPVVAKFQTDIIWIVWDLLLHYSKKKSDLCRTIIDNLLKLFCVRFGISTKKKRRFILYFAISLITENVDFNIKVFENVKAIENVKEKINVVYKQIKKNEKAPKTSYLFNNGIVDKNRNLEKTIKKLDKMNEVMNIIHRN